MASCTSRCHNQALNKHSKHSTLVTLPALRAMTSGKQICSDAPHTRARHATELHSAGALPLLIVALRQAGCCNEVQYDRCSKTRKECSVACVILLGSDCK